MATMTGFSLFSVCICNGWLRVKMPSNHKCANTAVNEVGYGIFFLLLFYSCDLWTTFGASFCLVIVFFFFLAGSHLVESHFIMIILSITFFFSPWEIAYPKLSHSGFLFSSFPSTVCLCVLVWGSVSSPSPPAGVLSLTVCWQSLTFTNSHRVTFKMAVSKFRSG